MRVMINPCTATLDFEASSLDETGYPIEVAFVVGSAGDIVMQFSALIRSRPHWRGKHAWSETSQRIHGIPIKALQAGIDADDLCDILNSALAGMKVTVDGGTYDTFWMQRLFDGRHQTFELDHLSGVDSKAFIAMKQRASPRHRALPDAVWLWETLTRLSQKDLS